MWKEVILTLANDSQYLKFSDPAKTEVLEQVEDIFNIKLPTDLVEMLQEINGDGDFLLSASEIIEANLNLREVYESYFMPLNCMLFIARNGAGDFYGYPIYGSGELDDSKIYLWNHETDDRIWVADSLADLIKKWYTDQLG